MLQYIYGVQIFLVEINELIKEYKLILTAQFSNIYLFKLIADENNLMFAYHTGVPENCFLSKKIISNAQFNHF